MAEMYVEMIEAGEDPMGGRVDYARVEYSVNEKFPYYYNEIMRDVDIILTSHGNADMIMEKKYAKLHPKEKKEILM